MSATPRQRTGAHRSRRRPGVVAVPVALAVLIVGGLLGVRLLGSGGGAGESAATSSAATASSTPADGGTPSVRPAESPSGPSSASVDRSARLTVLNGTRRPGLATRVASTLRSAGWTVASLGNYREGAAATTVYYAEPRLRATAVAISRDLPGRQQVVQSGRFGAAVVTVVLSSDYAG